MQVGGNPSQRLRGRVEVYGGDTKRVSEMYLVEGFDGYVMIWTNRTDEHHILPTLEIGNNGDEARMQDQDDPQTMG